MLPLWRPRERRQTSRAARVEGGELPQSGWPLVHIARRLADLIVLCDAAVAGRLRSFRRRFLFRVFSFARRCVDEIAQASFV